MLPFLCLFKIIACPTLDYVLPVVNVYLKHLLDVEELWCTIVEGKVVDVEVRLEGSALPEHVQHYIRNCIALEIDGNPKTITAGKVLDLGDSRNDSILSVVVNLLYKLCLVDLIRKLSEVDGGMGLIHVILALAVCFGNLILTSDDYLSLTCGKGIHNAFLSMDNTSRRKVRTLNYLRNLRN